MKFSEDTLVQQTTADYFKNSLGWESEYAFNQEDFGPKSLLGRSSERDVVLTRDLRFAIEKLNPGLPRIAYDDAVRQVVDYSASQTLLDTNRDKYEMVRNGVKVSFRNTKEEMEKRTLKLIDFENPENNRFLVVRELKVAGQLYNRRMDLIGFVNGIPLLFIECKNIHLSLKKAFDGNLSDYKDTVPHIFHHNAIVMLANGEKAKIGSISSKYGHFHEWKRLAEEDPGVVDMETMLKGVCSKSNFLDMIENFIVFDDSKPQTAKIVAKNHQFLGVNRALESVRTREERQRKLGVFWHTQGSGKSYSMVFFTRKVHRKLGGNFTFLICTDREDLDGQIYKSFAGCDVVNNDRDPCRATSGEHLQALLGQQKTHVFSLIQKFNQKVDPSCPWSLRGDLIVISDEAHRTQYGLLALNMRNALPNASYIGFTGTPLFKDDEVTKRIFGDYVSKYDFQRAVDDGATVPLFYDARGDKLGIETTGLNERMAEVLEQAEEQAELENIDVRQKLEEEIKREYHILTASERLDQVAQDFVWHYSTLWETGKAMLICIDKITCVRIHKLIDFYWKERIKALRIAATKTEDDQEEATLQRQIAWMEETIAAVVVSEEQGEVKKFERWGLDIQPYRKRIKEGFDLPDGKRIDIETAYKDDEHPFRIAIVCAMWLTGFDVPSLANLYIDKPLKAHTLMQAIARANRVNEGKVNGLVVDYCGILKGLRKALATFAGHGDSGRPSEEEIDPTHPEEELLESLRDAIAMTRTFLAENGASLDDIQNLTNFGRNAAIVKAKEAANQNDETRKSFEILCREVFNKFRACLTTPAINDYRIDYNAIGIIYKSLQDDKKEADTTDIIKRLHEIVGQTIRVVSEPNRRTDETYDISRIDFDRLRKEFERNPTKNSQVQELKALIERRLGRMLAQNPLRTDFQAHYEELIAFYNSEKDRVTIERTFEELIKFAASLDEEDTRDVREGLTAESLAIFDLLKKEDLSKAEIKNIKSVAVDLLEKLKAKIEQIHEWREREASRDAVRVAIRDSLWVGLPSPTYNEADVDQKVEEIFRHVYFAYPTVPSPIYAS